MNPIDNSQQNLNNQFVQPVPAPQAFVSDPEPVYQEQQSIYQQPQTTTQPTPQPEAQYTPPPFENPDIYSSPAPVQPVQPEIPMYQAQAPIPVDQQPVQAEQQPQQQSQSQKISDGRTTAMTTTEALNTPTVFAQSQDGKAAEARKRNRRNRNRGRRDQVRNNQPNANISPNPSSGSDEVKDEVIAEIEELENKVAGSNMPDELRERALRSIERLRRMARRGSYTGEFETVEKYIYWITSIPWGEYSQDNLDVANAKRIMDQSHYGMNTVKNLVLDYLAVMQLQLQQGKNDAANNAAVDMAVLRGSSANAPVMIFVGLQGVGKTSIAKSIANSMGREFARVAVGAVGSVQALRGQSKAFLDAEPGGIIKALTRTKSMNPVILLDEIDKASGNSGLLNDIMAALLEILDPEQNSTFIDHYVDYPVDLSKVFFICTANNLGSLSAALLDRMEVIRFTSYSDDEKIVIAKNYSMPKVIKNSGMSPDQLIIEEAVWPILVRPVGFDAGLRQLERNLATMVRSAARRLIEGTQAPITVTPENVREFVLPDQGPLS